MRSRNVVLDISISNHPGCSTRPERAKSRVPVEDRSPKAANASPPLMTIQGRLETVSTLLTTVGSPYRPTAAGKKGGLILGKPRFPSRLSKSAVSFHHVHTDEDI